MSIFDDWKAYRDKKQSHWTEKCKVFDEAAMKETIKKNAAEHDLPQTMKAVEFARILHGTQWRKTDAESVAYINHPYTLACHALAMKLYDDDLIASALLHDVVEDCIADVCDLPAGEKVKHTVELVTFDESSAATRAIAKKKYFEAIYGDAYAMMVKILDRCHNISYMAFGFRKTKIISYINETETYIYPMYEQIAQLKPEWKEAVWLIQYQTVSMVESAKRFV